MTKTDLLIIGSGPAGLAAADFVSNYDINVMLIDEQARPGGQIYRQPPRSFNVGNWLTSRIYENGKQLLSKVSAIEKIRWLTQTTVLGLTDNKEIAPAYPHKVTVCNQHGTQDITAKCVLIAAGCHDMSVIFPGWNLPGVMATGGIQAFVKSQQLVPGEKFLFAGTHPLQLIVADQVTQAGGKVAGVVFAQPFSRVFSLLKSPGVVLRHIDKFLYIAGALLRLSKAGVPVSFGKSLIRADGDSFLKRVSIAPLDREGNIRKDRAREIECDRLGVCFSFIASSELARQCGADYTWSSEGGGWIIKHDEWMGTNVPGIYVAGEVTGVAGAEVAMEEGLLAGIAITRKLTGNENKQTSDLAEDVRRRLSGLNQFADLLKKLSCPSQKLLAQLMDEECTLCKCEEITLGEFNKQLGENPHIGNANAAKLLSRTGMGLCQGRYCHYHITRLLARYRSVSEDKIGAFTARFPAKPIQIKELIK